MFTQFLNASMQTCKNVKFFHILRFLGKSVILPCRSFKKNYFIKKKKKKIFDQKLLKDHNLLVSRDARGEFGSDQARHKLDYTQKKD